MSQTSVELPENIQAQVIIQELNALYQLVNQIKITFIKAQGIIVLFPSHYNPPTLKQEILDRILDSLQQITDLESQIGILRNNITRYKDYTPKIFPIIKKLPTYSWSTK